MKLGKVGYRSIIRRPSNWLKKYYLLCPILKGVSTVFKRRCETVKPEAMPNMLSGSNFYQSHLKSREKLEVLFRPVVKYLGLKILTNAIS